MTVVTMTGTNFADPMSARLTYASGWIVDVPCILDATTPTTTATFTMPDEATDTAGEVTQVAAYVHAAVPALSAELPFECWSLPPTLVDMVPDMIPLNTLTDTTVSVYGTNFLAPAFARLEDPQGSGTFVEKPLTLISDSHGEFVVTAGDVTGARIIDVSVRVEHAEPEVTAEVLPLDISGAPILDDITPDDYDLGAPMLTVVATGRNFTADCVMWLEGPSFPAAARTTTVVSATELSSPFGPHSGTAETWEFWIKDSAGNESVRLPFVLIPATPTITSISPTEFHHNDAAVTVNVDGTGFVKTSKVLVSGNEQATTYVSPTRLTISLDPVNTTGADIVWPVKVRNPAPGGDSANSVNGTTVPEPTLTSISPTSRVTTDPETTITFTGTNFTPECKIKTDTGDMAGVVFVNRTTMTCKANWNSAMTQNLKVVDEKNHATVSKTFTVNNPPPPPTPTVTSANGSIDPFMGGTIYLNGTNFVAPMTCNLGAMTSFCDLNENYAIGSSSGGVIVDSPTTAHIQCLPQDGHYSVASPDNSHKVRVTTPAGTSPWCDGQPINV